jgi:hypothetical protein
MSRNKAGDGAEGLICLLFDRSLQTGQVSLVPFYSLWPFLLSFPILWLIYEYEGWKPGEVDNITDCIKKITCPPSSWCLQTVVAIRRDHRRHILSFDIGLPPPAPHTPIRKQSYISL